MFKKRSYYQKMDKMAETIEHRIANLMEAGIVLFTFDKSQNEHTQARNPFSRYYSQESNIQLLGLFSNRGAEYLITSFSIPVGSQEKDPILEAARKIAKAKEPGWTVVEVHAIEDPVLNKTFYFCMPRDGYWRD